MKKLSIIAAALAIGITTVFAQDGKMAPAHKMSGKMSHSKHHMAKHHTKHKTTKHKSTKHHSTKGHKMGAMGKMGTKGK